MLNTLKPFPEDKIIRLIREFADDPRSSKVDLGVGVYRNAEGITPVMRSVRIAGRRIWETEKTKTYTSLAGETDFRDEMRRLVMSDSVSSKQIATIHTPGGTGAVRQGLELFKMTSSGKRIWLSEPTWPNHQSIVRYLGIPCRTYRYFDAAARSVDFESMMADLDAVEQGDAVILHGCCHNPTGADPDLVQWNAISESMLRRRAIPIIDLAYQGFGDGLEADVQATRLIAAMHPQALIAVSCSKNFGIYRERTGLLITVAGDSNQRELAQSALTFLNRQNYSFPPDHGARIVATILNDESLRSDWEVELDEIRNGLLKLRLQLAEELKAASQSDRFGFISAHRGMFSLTGASSEQVREMRQRHGIYMVDDGRINVAGLTPQNVPAVAAAMLDVGM